MHTPASMVTGIVFAPLGLVLVFTAAITPQWREGQARLGGAGHTLGGAMELLLLRSDGLWESCLQVANSELRECWPVSGSYQRDARVRCAQGLILSSLFLCGTGIVLASIGVRCWTDTPLRTVAAGGGLLVALSGLLSLVALAMYTHHLSELGVELVSTTSDVRGLDVHELPSLSLRPAGSLYFGWVGACVQVLGGLALLFGVRRPQCPSCPARCPSCPARACTGRAEAYELSC